MSADVFDNPVTPELGIFQTKGSQKLLVVIFVVDASRTMENGRIGAVNNALRELKYKLSEIKSDNNLDLRVAIMSFTSSARWEVNLTPVEELNFNDIQTRPGLTEYGTAFHELNKVLTKEKFMKHTGKIAPPAIMFLTDGEPSDNYAHDLEELLKNGWFANASRSAVLIGDAIYNDTAKSAVAKFVNNENDDIVAAEDSTVIIQKIQIATMHTIAGDPMADNVNIIQENENAPSPVLGFDSPVSNPFDDPFGNSDGQDDLFGSSDGQDDPFGGSDGQEDPFGNNDGQDVPFFDNPFDN